MLIYMNCNIEDIVSHEPRKLTDERKNCKKEAVLDAINKWFVCCKKLHNVNIF